MNALRSKLRHGIVGRAPEAGSGQPVPVEHRSIIPAARIDGSILLLRGQNVILDAELASLYAVSTKALLQAVRRNTNRFPADFMFQLSPAEFRNLRSQIVTSRLWGGRRYRPYAFTEQGVAMLSSVLRSERAVRVNIEIMRTFVRLRQMMSSHVDLARKLNDLEQRYDGQFKVVFDAIRRLMSPPVRKRKPIGFRTELEGRAPRQLDGPPRT